MHGQRQALVPKFAAAWPACEPRLPAWARQCSARLRTCCPGPLAGAALPAGATGKLLFGALGFLLAFPMLRRLRRHTRSWRLPGGALALMAVIYTFSSFVIGPALTGADEQGAPVKSIPAAPAGTSPAEHESHHR